MEAGLVDAFLAANTDRMREARPIHIAWTHIQTRGLQCEMFVQLHAATLRCLQAQDNSSPDRVDIVSHKLVSALIGAMRSIFNNGVEEELVFLQKSSVCEYLHPI